MTFIKKNTQVRLFVWLVPRHAKHFVGYKHLLSIFAFGIADVNPVRVVVIAKFPNELIELKVLFNVVKNISIANRPATIHVDVNRLAKAML